MVALSRALLGGLVVVLGALSLGCDAGGLLVAEGKRKPGGPSGTELVSGGTLATNGKYRLFYVLGQPTPQQGVATSPEHRLNGGLTGAVNSK